MRRTTYTWVVLVCLAPPLTLRARGQSPEAASAGASVPHLIRFSGVLKDASGQPLSGAVNLTFSLYSLSDGGTPLWVESQMAELDEQGHYTVLLGATSPSGLPLDLFVSGAALWLGVQPQLAGEVERPRILLAAVPYALKAADAETLGGKPASAYLTVESESSAGTSLAPGTAPSGQAAAVSQRTPAPKPKPATQQPACHVASDGTAAVNSLAMFTPSACNIESSVVFQSGSNIGIGTTTPGAKLEVNGATLLDSTVTLNSPRQGLSAGYFGTNSTYSLYQVNPNQPGAGNFSGSFTTTVFNSTPDPLTSWGYNTNGSVPVLLSEPFFAWNLESNYNDGGGTGPGDNVMETYIQFIPAGGGKAVRPFYVNVRRLSTSPVVALLDTPAAGGSVGVATGSPGATLDVAGTNLPIAAANPGTNGALGFQVSPQNGGAALSGNNTGGNGGGVNLFSGSGGASLGTAANSNGGNIQLQVGSAGTGGSGAAGHSGYVLLNPHGGDVGIGTATPSAALEVNGTAQFDRNVSIAGNLTVTGTVSKGGGSFRIDHPLDTAHKYLSHSFVESPDMMNIYNGNAVTNEKGEAEVVLPDYFEALNGDFRYQLTVIGQFAQAIVGSKIKNHRFTIRTDKPGVEVSWQVTGIRHDAWANVHRIVVEEEKQPQEQGHYPPP